MASAAAAFRAGQLDRADTLLRQVVEKEPSNIEARLGLGMVAGSSGRLAEAIERMGDVLRLDPNCGPALQWLTILSVDSGHVEECLKFGQQFLQLHPDNAQVLDAVGRCLLQRDRLAEALSCFEKACALEPKVGQLHYSRGAALKRLSRDEEAVAALKTAIQLSPGVEPYLRLAEIEHGLGRYEDAVASCREALKLSERDPNVHTALARCLAALGRREESEEHWDRAQALDPTSRLAIMERAESRIIEGQFQEAAGLLRRALEQDGRNGPAFRTLAHIQRSTGEDRPLIDRMRRLVDDPTLPEEDRLDVYYGLGKALHDLGEFEAAMKAYDEANAIKFRVVMGGQKFDREAFRAYVDRQIRLYTPELFERTQAAACHSRLPIVVVGLLRSGTTLAEQILSCHPDVGSAGEQPFWIDYEPQAVKGTPPSLDEVRARQLGNQYAGVLESIAPGFPFGVVDKNPANSLVVGLIHMALPEVRMLRMRRNAVDVALSTWMTPMRTSAPFVCDRESIVFAYSEVLRLMDHWRAILPADRYMEVSYEALAADPEPRTREMVAFLGLEWNDACLHPEANTRPVRTPSFWQVRRPVYTSSTEKWRNYELWLGPFAELQGLS